MMLPSGPTTTLVLGCPLLSGDELTRLLMKLYKKPVVYATPPAPAPTLPAVPPAFFRMENAAPPGGSGVLGAALPNAVMDPAASAVGPASS